MGIPRARLYAIIVLYALLMIMATSIFSIPRQPSYELSLIGPLPEGYSGIMRVLEYNSSSGVLVARISTSRGVGVLVESAGRTVFISLKGFGEPRDACTRGNYVYILTSQNKVIKYDVVSRGAWMLQLEPAGSTGSRIICGDVLAVILSSNDYTTIAGITMGDKPSVRYVFRLEGSLISETASGDKLYIALNKDNIQEISLVRLSDGRIIKSIIIPQYMNISINKIIYTDRLYILGSNGNIGAIYIPETLDLYRIKYNSTGETLIEVVIQDKDRVVALVRPPASWMQIVEIEPSDKATNIELFSSYMYSFLYATSDETRGIDIVGITYNGSQRYISILKALSDNTGIISEWNTVFVAKHTGNDPSIIHVKMKYLPGDTTRGKARLHVSEPEKLDIPVEELNTPKRILHEEKPYLRRILTLTALTVPLAYITYSSIIESSGETGFNRPPKQWDT
ncbi:MAG: hypothetical protein F7C38_01820 [Desulfurococcales archaeon]|nr:hypothetical protein [Desulfurococcales archaeon]